MAEKKKAAKMENHSAEIVTQLLKKGKKNGGTLSLISDISCSRLSFDN